MCFEEIVGGFFAGVEVNGSDKSADEVRAGFFDGDAFFELALLVFEVEFGALGVVELCAFDFVAEVVVFDGPGADASPPAAFSEGGFLVRGVCDFGEFFDLGSCAVDRGISGFYALALEEAGVDFSTGCGGDFNPPLSGYRGERFGTAVAVHGGEHYFCW